MAKVFQKVVTLKLGFVNTFIIKGKGCILVDAGVTGSSGKIIGALKNNGLKPGDVSLIIATHCHADHVGDLPELARKTGAKVAIHKNAAEYLNDGKSDKVVPVGISGRILRMILWKMTDIKAMEPDIVIGDEMDLDEYGVAGKVIHTPGHTKGCVSVILSSGEAIVGDLMYGSMLLNGYKGGYPPFSYDIDMVRRSIRKVLDCAPNIILPSHSGPCKPDVIKEKFLI